VKVTGTSLPGVCIVEPTVYRDGRGFFLESFNANHFAQYGLPAVFRQDNWSRSRQDVLRGLHYQLRHPQGKLVSVTRGRIFDVAVDIRRGSPTFGRWFGTVLAEERPQSLWIPPGFAHGFCALADLVDVVYKCTDVYVPEDDHGVLWSDPRVGIAWPTREPILSDKDRTYAGLDPSRADLPEYGG
jgi:dTDP-4-dehydrorhamnose 3,5-epimerase